MRVALYYFMSRLKPKTIKTIKKQVVDHKRTRFVLNGKILWEGDVLLGKDEHNEKDFAKFLKENERRLKNSNPQD